MDKRKKHNLDAMTEQFTLIIEIGYYLAMGSFNKESKKNDLC